MKGQTVNGGMAGGWEEQAKDPACLTDVCLPHLLTVLRDSGGRIRRGRGKQSKDTWGRGRLLACKINRAQSEYFANAGQSQCFKGTEPVGTVTRTAQSDGQGK